MPTGPIIGPARPRGEGAPSADRNGSPADRVLVYETRRKGGGVAAIDDLLGRIADAALRADLERELAPLREEQQLGLVFERHLPEKVRLPGLAVRRGLTVEVRADPESPMWQVAKVEKGEAHLVRKADNGTVLKERMGLDALIVVQEFGKPVYPGLRSVGRVEKGGDKPYHIVINAENYHGLQVLRYTCAGQVDVIYIDPPYNLGGDLTYNDKRIAADDGFRHSKWLSFMEKRLALAVDVLKETGVIVAAIDDTEQAHLRLLMDQIFGEQNFIACVAWQGGVKNDARFTGGGLDYMLIYAKNKTLLTDLGTRWREPKESLADVLEQGRLAWEASGGDHLAATRALSSWWNKNKKRYDPGLGDNVKVDVDGTVIKVSDLSWPGGGGPRYDVLHPETGQPVKVPTNGWRFPKPETMQAEIAAGRVLFGPDHTSSIRRKTPLAQMENQVVRPSFYSDRRAAAKQLKDLLGEQTFDFPKDPAVLARWIDLVSGQNKDAVVLDFFAGSASSAHAVMLLNDRDGGRRRSILVTNNEVSEKAAVALTKAGHIPGDAAWESMGVFQRTTMPRLKAVVTGRRPDGSVHSQGSKAENVEFLTMTYEDPDRVKLGAAFESVAPLLWLMSGASGSRIDKRGAGWSVPEDATYGVLFNENEWPGFCEAVSLRSEEITHAFVVTDSDAVYQRVVAELPSEVQAVRLYENYLTSFAINVGGRS